MRRHHKFGAAAFLLAAALSPAHAQAELPDGKGKETMKKVCGNCHEVETVIASRRTKIGWERNVDDMVTRGAEGTDEELAAVMNYLTTFFGKINVNTASLQDLKSLDFADKEAQAIMKYREQNGSLKNFEQLTKVPGLDVEKLQAKRSRIAFSL